MHPISSLFLSQSYQDAWADYSRALVSPQFVHWDYVILTASNEQQAEGFEAQLEERRQSGFLPPETRFAVIPDPMGKRVGSGGATLGVLKYVAEQTGKTDFSGLRILVIHSGGDSKRVPQYSALGKLFSPVPHELPNGRASTLFDEFMIAMATVPSRVREGMLLLSGDVLLLFNPLLIDYSGKNAAAISFKENVKTGKNHGVFLRGEDGNVRKFMHKQTVETLRECGAVNEQDCVDIDTGAIIFSKEMLAALYRLISKEGKFDGECFAELVNEKVRLSLYGDFLYPLAADSTLEDFYKETPEGSFCPELQAARRKIWETLRPFRMKLLRLVPAKFIHFGTTGEILELMSSGVADYIDLGWSRHVGSSFDSQAAGYNSVLSSQAVCGQNCYLEVSYVHHKAELGDNVLLSYIDVYDEKIPSNVVVHGLKQKDGNFVARIYGTEDNPKAVFHDSKEDGAGADNCLFLGLPFRQLIEKNGITAEELWEEGEEHTIWNARLYPACATIREALRASLNLYAMTRGNGDVSEWRSQKRKSLCSGFNEADAHALIAWEKRMGELVQMDRLSKLIRAGGQAAQGIEILKTRKLSPVQEEWLEKHLQRADFGERMRLHYYVGTALGGAAGDKQIGECFRCIGAEVLASTLENLQVNGDCRIVTEKHRVSLPLRVNWGGGWSDTPPYCNEKGGTVLNAAILLNGKRPVEVALERIPEPKIIFDSRDMDVYGEFEEITALQQTGDPYDPFALQKAALLACGILPMKGGNLKEILNRMGGGFLMRSEVTGVPKGSGLGTSSILAAACVKALLEFTGISYDEEQLYSTVLCMEQIMSTGGGWQDQVGGITEGIKYTTAAPGIRQNMKVHHIRLPEETQKELGERFALIYTGQRRLARNLLRDVVGNYIGNEPDTVYALNEIQKAAALMAFELCRGHVDDFARLLGRHWELSQKIDKGSTNILIDQIFDSISDLIDGRMICGAGGGGFLQVVLKKGISKEMLHDRLKEVFQDSDIDVWDCELI